LYSWSKWNRKMNEYFIEGILLSWVGFNTNLFWVFCCSTFCINNVFASTKLMLLLLLLRKSKVGCFYLYFYFDFYSVKACCFSLASTVLHQLCFTSINFVDASKTKLMLRSFYFYRFCRINWYIHQQSWCLHTRPLMLVSLII
jgi:hypothetical protein